jgi:hypothetical protein
MRAILEPEAQVECWFRKSPATFVELVTRPDPANYWIVKMGLPICEFGDTMFAALSNAFFALNCGVWTQEGIRLRLGHTDLIVARGTSSFGGVLINKQTTRVPLGWYSRVSILGKHLLLVYLDRIQ